MNADKLAAHLRIDRYGDFWLTDAIRPSPKQLVTPKQGYRVETYRDLRNNLRVPVLAAAVSREKLFDLFLSYASIRSAKSLTSSWKRVTRESQTAKGPVRLTATSFAKESTCRS